MESSEGGRPTKRVKTESSVLNPEGQSKDKQKPKWRGQQIEYKRQQRRDELNHPQPETSEHRRDRELFGIDEDLDKEIGLKPLQDEEREKLRKIHVPKLFSQPSVIATGDKGIFVTCDKGREKKCLTELADLVERYLEERDFIPAELVDPNVLLQTRLERQQKKAGTVNIDNEDSPVEEEEIDIESSINAELSGMQPSHPADDSSIKVRAFQLITLDVPCVSFLRFIPGNVISTKVDVVDLAHSICADAAKNPGRMRSRYIKRLSPVTWLGKVLSGGLEKACEETLPAHFKLDATADESKGIEEEEKNAADLVKQAVTFAIRPTTRNNDKVSRDEIIKKVADQVKDLGNGQHKVDLKGYEKGILVEVYRGWIGMSVVDNTSSTATDNKETENKVGYGFGYEALKKFNLAEIYADGLKKNETKT